MRYWKFANGSVQSCSNDAHVVPAATEVTKFAFDQVIAALPVRPLVQPRDILAEIDDLKAKLKAAGINV